MAMSSSWQGRWLVYSRCGWPIHVCAYCGAHLVCESHLGTHANGGNSALSPLHKAGNPSLQLGIPSPTQGGPS